MREQGRVATAAQNGDYKLLIEPLSFPILLGMIIEFTEIKRVNRIFPSRASSTSKHVVTKETSVGETEVNLYPALIARGRYKTVSRLPHVGDWFIVTN